MNEKNILNIFLYGNKINIYCNMKEKKLSKKLQLYEFHTIFHSAGTGILTLKHQQPDRATFFDCKGFINSGKPDNV
ncbi:MAG: hypothetical protein JJU13_16525 [Balneolaceae bacterium]|nr:hypothetical protein [Balneolaceae bacterium]